MEALEEHRFNIYEVFAFFDQNAHAEIYVRDIRRGLDELGEEFKQIDDTTIHALIKRYESGGRGGLKRKEFSEMFESLDQELKEIMNSRKPKSDLTKGFCEAMFIYRVKKVLVAFMLQVLLNEKYLAELK